LIDSILDLQDFD